MELTNLSVFVKEVGFPIVVALFCLIRIDKKLDRILIILSKQTEYIKGNSND